MNCDPNSAARYRSAGSLFLAGEAEKEVFWASSPVRLSPPGTVRAEGRHRRRANTSRSLVADFHDDYLRPGQAKLPKRWWSPSSSPPNPTLIDSLTQRT